MSGSVGCADDSLWAEMFNFIHAFSLYHLVHMKWMNLFGSVATPCCFVSVQAVFLCTGRLLLKDIFNAWPTLQDCCFSLGKKVIKNTLKCFKMFFSHFFELFLNPLYVDFKNHIKNTTLNCALFWPCVNSCWGKLRSEILTGFHIKTDRMLLCTEIPRLTWPKICSWISCEFNIEKWSLIIQ